MEDWGDEGAMFEQSAHSHGIHVQKSPKNLPKLDLEAATQNAAKEKLNISAKFEQIAKSRGIKLEDPKTSPRLTANLNRNIDKPENGQSKDIPLLTPEFHSATSQFINGLRDSPEGKVTNDKLESETSSDGGVLKETKRSKVSEQILRSNQTGRDVNPEAESDEINSLAADKNKMPTSKVKEGAMGLKSAISELKSLAREACDPLVKCAEEIIIKVRLQLLFSY